MNEPLQLPKGKDASKRICVRDAGGVRVWKLIGEIDETDRVVEIGKGFGLIGNGLRVPLAAFRK